MSGECDKCGEHTLECRCRREVFMRNRAKCRLCSSIIESVHPSDIVYCKCGEIGVLDGEAMRCHAKSWDNFIRVDDEGNEIVPRIISDNMPSDTSLSEDIYTSRDALLEDIERLIKAMEGLPAHALDQPVTHRDYASLLGMISRALRLS